MKTKHILKTVGLISALSFSSIALISCDDDDNSGEVAEQQFRLFSGDRISFTDDGEAQSFTVIDDSTMTFTDGSTQLTSQYRVEDLDNNLTRITIAPFGLTYDQTLELVRTAFSDPNSDLRNAIDPLIGTSIDDESHFDELESLSNLIQEGLFDNSDFGSNVAVDVAGNITIIFNHSTETIVSAKSTIGNIDFKSNGVIEELPEQEFTIDPSAITFEPAK